MGIKVKHDVAGKVSGPVAYATGRGQRRERDIRAEEAAAKERARLQAAAAAQARALAAQRSEAQKNREFTADRDVYSRAGRVADLEFGRESTSIAAKEALKRHGIKAKFDAKMDLDRMQQGYDQTQKNQLKQLQKEINYINANTGPKGSGMRFLPNEGEQLVYEKMDQINRVVPGHVESGPTPQEEMEKGMVTDPVTGERSLKNPKTGVYYQHPVDKFKQDARDTARETAAQVVKIKEKKDEAEYKQRTNTADLAEKIYSGENFEGTPEKALRQARMFYAKERSPEEKNVIRQLKKDRGMTDDLINRAIEEEGSLQAVIQRIQAEEGHGKRPDGTQKQNGFLGVLSGTDAEGKTFESTEYSVQSGAVKVDGRQIDFPTLVPTLTQSEIDLMINDIIPNKKDIPESIMQKAIQHANMRLRRGESVFWEPGDTTKEEFLKGARPQHTMPTGGVDREFRSLSGAGGAGGGRF